MKAPMDVPPTMSTGMPHSVRARMTPTCAQPLHQQEQEVSAHSARQDPGRPSCPAHTSAPTSCTHCGKWGSGGNSDRGSDGPEQQLALSLLVGALGLALGQAKAHVSTSVGCPPHSQKQHLAGAEAPGLQRAWGQTAGADRATPERQGGREGLEPTTDVEPWVPEAF